MSTQSTTSYEWSLKLIGTHFTIGIASQSNRDSPIHHYDENAIVYVSDPSSNKSIIRRGSTTIHSGLKGLDSGDVISFRFQPDTKKLIIDWVRTRDS